MWAIGYGCNAIYVDKKKVVWDALHLITSDQLSLEESLSITTIRCDFAIATHARKMQK